MRNVIIPVINDDITIAMSIATAEWLYDKRIKLSWAILFYNWPVTVDIEHFDGSHDTAHDDCSTAK